jgi:broad specificity phosphatase PhoE
MPRAPSVRVGSLLMPSVLLIRHGQASFGATDYDVLSDLGERQAAVVHAEIVRRGVAGARLVAGGLRRQRDTALPWTERAGKLEIDGRWNEYDSGDVLGAHSPADSSLERPVGGGGQALGTREFQSLLDDALLAWIDAGADSTAREPWPAFQGRCRAALTMLVDGLSAGETALVFTSGGVISALAARLLGLPDSAMVAFNHVVVNAAITKVVSGRRGMSLVSFNEHGHLEQDHIVTYR